jgi:inner membrane protein
VPAAALGARDTTLARRMAVGALAAAFPDSDYVATFVSPLTYLVNHRGVTHSILLLPLWAWLVAAIAALALRHPRGWRAYWGLAATGIGAHIFGDLITSYGTMVLAPLSDARFGWGTTFIIDPWFSGIVLAGLLLSLAWKRSRVPAVSACAALVAYVAFQAVLKSQAVDFGLREAAATGFPATRVSAQPGPVSPFNWMVVMEQDGTYRYSTVNLVRREPRTAAPDAGFLERLSAPFNPRAAALWREASLYGDVPDADLARQAWSQPELSFFKWFAEYPALYRIERGSPTCVSFYDLRFFRPGSDILPFRYGVCRDAGGAWRRFRLVGENVRAPLD